MTDLDMEVVRCSYHIHAQLSDDRRELRIRCNDGKCPEAVVARETDRICIHVWSLHDANLRMHTEFEVKSRRRIV